VIPLTISIRRWHTLDYVGAAVTSARPIIEIYLHNAARDGWQANEPTAFSTVFS